MAIPVSVEKQKEITRLHKQGLSYRAIAKRVGIHFATVGTYARGDGATPPAPALKQENTRTDDFGKDSAAITLRGTRIHSLDEMLKHCEVDLDAWEVERFLCNKWEVGAADKSEGKLLAIVVEPLFQVKVWLKKRVAIQNIKAEIAHFKAAAALHSPKAPAIIRMRSRDGSGVWVEHSMYDHHFGANIWAKETGHDDYDLTIAKQCWGDALAALADRTESHKPEGALFAVGNDQQNADNRAGTTEKGTPQTNDTRYQKVYGVSRDATIWAIDQMLARYGRVHVPVVMGNHDPLAAFHLGDYLAAWYRNDKRVTIDNAPTFRKWWEHGVNMLMLTHGETGKLEKYGETMAAEMPEMWGRTRWREAHTGDKHHRHLIEFPGFGVRILPSLRPLCAWSAAQMYGSIRAAESYVWSKTEGLIGQATYAILPGQFKAPAA